ncbi:Hypothetical predicted protein [Mytilus galloprovincialis]|uniref:Uncharacterized protein n=1 Tax=Mytilus galloprovincialis TaxID=29158 RepID=A0A8B6F5F1_MYTGA|nr:Hypothetical predicted protein [Mytilus galloprovincialis]
MATDVQLFLAIREIDKSVSTETKWLHEIANQHKVDELTLDLNTKPMEDMLETKSFGSVSIDRSRNTVPINHPNMKEAQIPREAKCNKIDQIRLQQNICIQYNKKRIDTNNFGCMICSNGDIILTDGPSKKFVVFNEKGNHIKDIPVLCIPSDLTEISEGQIAVTYGNEYKFEIADIKDYNYKTVKLVRTESTCWGTSCDNGQLVVKCTNNGIHMYDINGETTMKIKDDEIYGGLNLIYNIAIFNGRTYFSNSEELTYCD